MTIVGSMGIASTLVEELRLRKSRQRSARMLVVCGFRVNVHVACDDRVTLYPAAPLRLATLLQARTIAREGWGSSAQRQIGQAKSAMVFASHTPNQCRTVARGRIDDVVLRQYLLAWRKRVGSSIQ
jgi:hypothetical protein